jgi:hypothetical protein
MPAYPIARLQAESIEVESRIGSEKGSDLGCEVFAFVGLVVLSGSIILSFAFRSELG